ncbi:MAG: shikimate kinase [Pseudomonadota bacterium]|nr:shikimate kinase [Pseudomonadota bacterium]
MTPEPSPAADLAVAAATRLAQPRAVRAVVLVGLMGAGKTSVGRRLAAALGAPFVDSDEEVERAARMTVPEIFASMGEPSFRDGERRVIARLLEEGPRIIATGGGAWMNDETRAAIRARGAVVVWLRAELDVLVERVSRRAGRPLLAQGDPRQILARLIEVRHPVYAEADVTVDSRAGDRHEAVVARIIEALAARGDVAAAEQGAVSPAPPVSETPADSPAPPDEDD